MARSRRKQHTLFNPFVQAAMSDHNSWETEYAPSTRASSLRHLAIEQSLGTRGGSSDASSAKSSTKGSNRSVDALRRPTPYLHSPTLRALERDRTGETAISHLSTFSNVSPSDGAISIGLSPSLESDRQHGRQLVPETITPTGLKSAWSPDTPSTASSIEPRASSIYSQMTAAHTGSRRAASAAAPPVPLVPAAYASIANTHQTDLDQAPLTALDMSDSPFTLFSDDDDDYEVSTPASGKQARELAHSTQKHHHHHHMSQTQSAATSVDWLAHENTPSESPESIDFDWWEGNDGIQHRKSPALASRSAKDMLHVQHTPIIRVPTPKRSGSPASSMSASLHAVTPVRTGFRPEHYGRGDKDDEIWEEPPPYSPGAYTSPENDKPKRQIFAPVAAAALLRLPSVSEKSRAGGATTISIHATSTKSEHRAPLPSPGPVSPSFVQSLSAQGDVGMSNIPLTPCVAPDGKQLPGRSFGTFIPAAHALPTNNETERKRRRHEKEDYWAHRIGNAWRGRGPFRQNRYFGEPGDKGRKRRRWCCWIMLALILLIILSSALAAGLTRHEHNNSSSTGPRPDVDIDPDTSASPTSTKPVPTLTTTTINIFATATGFPPIPTGVLTVVAPINPVNDSSCVDPSPLWSCSLPPEEHESVNPFSANRPTFVMQIQWDRSEDNKWNTSAGNGGEESGGSSESPANSSSLLGDMKNGISERDVLFAPNPAPPSFDEMWFLGNTTDDIQDETRFAGEPTPFYISMLSTTSESMGPNARRLARRASDISSIPSVNLPPPELNDDGTGAAAVLFPLATQQPLRLFDRGLATEHYAFYTYYRRTIYVRSVGETHGTVPVVALDLDGGSREDQAKFLVTWGTVRYRVQLFTGRPDSPRTAHDRVLLDDEGSINGSQDLTSPGTMPLPATFSMDLHGGDASKKFIWHHDVTTESKIDTSHPGLVDVDMGKVETNRGGAEGGHGGCVCRWTNFRGPEVVEWEKAAR